MLNRNKHRSCLKLILLFVLLRVILNLFALQHYGFQRDELLHYTLGDHLDWGYKEVPPFIAVIAKIQSTVFGSYLFATRIFSTLASGLIILLTGLLVIELGGRRFAITVACLGLSFSPCFLASGYLFQPVVFDQLWWVLSAYLLVKHFNIGKAKYLYFLGLAVGLGMLTKYTMAFFTIALVTGILFTRQRTLFGKKGFWAASGIAALIFLPNAVWQLTHHLPLLTHMSKLRGSMLDYIKPGEFLLHQLLVNGSAVLIWLPGLCFLLFGDSLSKYRYLGFSYVITLLLFLFLHGKVYYVFGAYPMLFAAGGVIWEQLISIHNKVIRSVFITALTVVNLFFFPLVLPVLPLDTALPVFGFVSNTLKMEFPFIWDIDHKVHPITQDYADMLGWDELYLQVARVYKDIAPADKPRTIIFVTNYGEAGAIHRYGQVYSLPDAVCLDSSFSLWAPESINPKQVIFVDDKAGKYVELLYKKGAFGSYQKTGEILNPMAVEKGTAVFLLLDIKPAFNQIYQKYLAQTRLE